MQKTYKQTGEKNPNLFRISCKFLSKSRSNLHDSLYGSFSQVMEQLFWRFQAYFSNVLFDRFPSKLSLTTNNLHENVSLKWYKTVQCLVFLDDVVTLESKEHHLTFTLRAF